MRLINSTTTLIPALAASGLLIGCVQNGGNGDLDPAGLYYVESVFQTPRGLPETESAEIDSFYDLADHPERVGGWVLELIEDELKDPYKTGVRYLRDGVEADAEFQAFLEEEAPEMVEALAQLASDITDVTTSLSLTSELELRSEAGDMHRGIADHRMTGVIYRIDGSEYRYDFPEIGMATPSPMATDFIIHDNEVISFGDQRANLQYGRMVDYAIHEIISERMDPFADSFTDLVTSLVPCREAGQWLEDELDFGPSEIYGAACAAAFDKLATKVLPLEIDEMDVILDFNGDAMLVDNVDGNDRIDGLSAGEWEGTLAYPTKTITLRRPTHNFTATRSGSRRNNDDDVLGGRR